MNVPYIKYMSRSGSLILDFQNRKIVYDRTGWISDTLRLPNVEFPFHRITAVELFRPTFSKLGQISLIVDGRNYILENQQEVTMFSFAKQADFWDIEQKVLQMRAEGLIPAIYEKGVMAYPKELFKEVKPGLVHELYNGIGDTLEVYETHIILRHTGALNYFAQQGLKGDKRVLYQSITAVEFRKGTAHLNGFIQFSLLGGMERQGGIGAAAGDENSVIVPPSMNEKAQQIVDYIERRRMELMQPQVQFAAQPVSAADEIRKFKDLADAGVISYEEFEAKKRQLLGL